MFSVSRLSGQRKIVVFLVVPRVGFHKKSIGNYPKKNFLVSQFIFTNLGQGQDDSFLEVSNFGPEYEIYKVFNMSNFWWCPERLRFDLGDSSTRITINRGLPVMLSTEDLSYNQYLMTDCLRGSILYRILRSGRCH